MSTNVQIKTDYCNKRLAELGITDAENCIDIQFNEGFKPLKFITGNDNDDIVIHYFSIDGKTEQYKKGKWSEPYQRKRLNPANVNGHKYESPFGSDSRFFWSKLLIDAYKQATIIENLIITEGELKALKACKHGIYCAGIAGIHNYKDKDTGGLPSDLLQLIERCKIKNLVFLTDADCISKNYIAKALTENKDLRERLASFYTAVKNFRELCRTLPNVSVYFAHIQNSLENKAKGFDDLLCYRKGNESEIKEAIESLTTNEHNEYFEIIDLKADWVEKLLDKFLLNLDKNIYPKAFYKQFADVIANTEFTFGGCRYKNRNDKLTLTYHPEIFKYMRVRDSYYKLTYITKSDGKQEYSIVPWKKSEIISDFPFLSPRELIELIPKLESFVNVPDNTTNYQRIIHNCYNLYEPIKHLPNQGEFIVTEKFLRHIFKEHYLLALDYFSILFRNPTQKLPAICTVSKERNTGKTTFFQWIGLMFQNNAIILSNSDFSEKFNSYFAGKLALCIDETFIDKKSTAEHLKKLITDSTILVHPKGREAFNIEFFAKLFLSSNNVNDFLMIDPEENRYWILEVNAISKENEIPDLIKELERELPYFLHHIQNREIIQPHKTRFWFDYDLYKTDALKQVVSHSRSKLEKAIIEWFESIFEANININNTELEYIECTPKLLENELTERFNKYNDLRGEIKKIIRYKWGLKPEPMKKFTAYCLTEMAQTNADNEYDFQLYKSTRTGTPYKFNYEYVKSLF